MVYSPFVLFVPILNNIGRMDPGTTIKEQWSKYSDNDWPCKTTKVSSGFCDIAVQIITETPPYFMVRAEK